jgi:glycosyltransferase involved in cell wall biosynthesis
MSPAEPSTVIETDALHLDTQGVMAHRFVAAPNGRRLRVLFLSRSYPNNVLTLLGLWVEGLVRYSRCFCEAKVISPTPYCPPFPGLGREYARFRKIDRTRWMNDVEIMHPRFLVPPGHRLHGLESFTYYFGVRALADHLQRVFQFDLIHAHFTYPDGWVAACLGKRYSVPVIITEHAPWRPWMDDYPWVLRQAAWAFKQCAFHVSVSPSLQDDVRHFVGEASKLRVIPCGVDTSIFTLRNAAEERKKQILFAGVVRHVKGVDILLRAMRLLVDRGRPEKLVIVGESFYKNYQRDYVRIRQLAAELGLHHHVEFVGGKTQRELALYMQQSKALVLPSRKESLGMVLVEALACGTPVVATRCGGPEDILTDEVGVLVSPEDPEALARGLENVLDRQQHYNPVSLRAYALEKYSLTHIAGKYAALYSEAVAASRSGVVSC